VTTEAIQVKLAAIRYVYRLYKRQRHEIGGEKGVYIRLGVTSRFCFTMKSVVSAQCIKSVFFLILMLFVLRVTFSAGLAHPTLPICACLCDLHRVLN